MSATLRDVLAQRATQAGAPDFHVEELVAAGEHQLRRRRTTAVLGAAAAVVGVLALVLAVATLNGPVGRGEGPVDHPPTDRDPAGSARRIVYSDLVHTTAGRFSGAVHLGSRVVATGNAFVHLDVTDAGFIYTLRGAAWFSDGGKPGRIGSDLCSATSNGEFSSYADRGVMSANAGSLAAWFECSKAGGTSLVVFDTDARNEVGRTPIGLCRKVCELVDVTTRFVYFDVGRYTGRPSPGYRLDVRSNSVRPSTSHDYAADLTNRARGLVVGNTWESGTATHGVGQSFRVAGQRLVPQLNNAGDDYDAKAFDTATGRALHLRLPKDYHAIAGGFTLFEWLDDETVAIVSGGDWSTGDILACRLSDGRCVLSVSAPAGAGSESVRIVPSFPLPG